VRLEDALRLAEGMSGEERERLAGELLEVILSTVNAEMVPDEVGWKVMEAARAGKLSEPMELAHLLYAVSLAEPSKLERILRGEKD